MLRTVNSPNDWDDYTSPVPVELGGLSGSSASESLAILDGVPKSKIGQPLGPVPLGADGGIDPKYLGSTVTGLLSIDGDRYIDAGATKEYLMTTYDVFTNYEITAVTGTVSRNGNVITYTASNKAGLSGFVINGRRVRINVGGDGVVPPDIIAPVNLSINRPIDMEFHSSEFQTSGYTYTDTFVSSDWELSTNDSFSSLARKIYGKTVDKTSWSVLGLEYGTIYYVRVRYNAGTFGATEWSETVVFTVKSAVERAVITSPTFNTVGITDQLVVSTAFFKSDISAVKVPVYSGGNVTGYNELTMASQHASSDWQLSSTSSFESVDLSGHIEGGAINYSVIGLNPNEVYYLRVRHNLKYLKPMSMDTAGTVTTEEVLKLGEWSDIVIFTTLSNFSAAAPTITSPGSGTTNHTPDTTAVANAYFSPVGDTHVSSDWEIATDIQFTNVVRSTHNDVVNKTSFLLTNLPEATVFYVRVRYNGERYTPGRWSNTISFSTLPSYVPSAPVITTPVANATNQSSSFTAVASAYSSPLSAAHLNSDWELATDNLFVQIVQSSYADSGNKLTWALAGLMVDTRYYLRVRYRDGSNHVSAWSAVSTFRTVLTKPIRPTILTPTVEQTLPAGAYTITSSAFDYPGNSHANSDWEVYSTTTNELVFSSYFDATNKVSLPMNDLAVANYKVRVRYRTSMAVASEWSDYRLYHQLT